MLEMLRSCDVLDEYVERDVSTVVLTYTLSEYDQPGHALNAFQKHPIFTALGGRLRFEMWDLPNRRDP